jgi:hypothetical protein
MASVAEIDGLTVPAGSVNVPPLDTYTGAAAAYSVRLLRTAYTGDIMRVRRDSDNVEADVGFDSNNEFGLTSPISNPSSGGPFTDFADFIGHGATPANGFCRYWYDQSGNAVDAGQATQTSQPKIYDSGTGIIVAGATGKEKPALDFDGSNDFFDVPSTQWSDGEVGVATVIDSLYNIGSTTYLMTDVTILRGAYGFAGSFIIHYPTVPNQTNATNPSNGQRIITWDVSSGNASLRYDGSVAATQSITGSISTASTSADIGRRTNGTAYLDGIMQEMIIWSTATNIPNIETNLNNYYLIY